MDQFLARGSASGGFTRIPNILFRRAKALGIDRASLDVLEVLISLRRGDDSCVSIKRLAHDANLSERKVKDCTRRLEGCGAIGTTRFPWSRGSRHTNSYDLAPLVELMERSLADEPWLKYSVSARNEEPACE